jgi:hypothetical protein
MDADCLRSFRAYPFYVEARKMISQADPVRAFGRSDAAIDVP